MIAQKIKVFGRVQGVFFRHSSRVKAKELKLNGYVKNLEDGSVEIFIQGEKEAIGKFIEWAKIGPFLANVEKIEIEPVESTKQFSDFDIL